MIDHEIKVQLHSEKNYGIAQSLFEPDNFAELFMQRIKQRNCD